MLTLQYEARRSHPAISENPFIFSFPHPSPLSVLTPCIYKHLCARGWMARSSPSLSLFQKRLCSAIPEHLLVPSPPRSLSPLSRGLTEFSRRNTIFGRLGVSRQQLLMFGEFSTLNLTERQSFLHKKAQRINIAFLAPDGQ